MLAQPKLKAVKLGRNPFAIESLAYLTFERFMEYLTSLIRPAVADVHKRREYLVLLFAAAVHIEVFANASIEQRFPDWRIIGSGKKAADDIHCRRFFDVAPRSEHPALANSRMVGDGVARVLDSLLGRDGWLNRRQGLNLAARIASQVGSDELQHWQEIDLAVEKDAGV